MHKPVPPAPHANPPLRGDPIPLPQGPQPDDKPPVQGPSTRRARDDLANTPSSSGDDQAARLLREQT